MAWRPSNEARNGVGARALNRRVGRSEPLRLARFVHKPSQESQLRRSVRRISPNARRREGVQLFEDVGFLPTIFPHKPTVEYDGGLFA